MRRQTGNEIGFNDWMNLANGVKTVQGAFHSAENQGFKREDRENNKAMVEASDSALTMMRDGLSLEDTRTGMQGKSLSGSALDTEQNYNTGVAMNWNREGDKPAFDPTVAELGFQNAIQTDLNSQQKITDKKSAEFQKQFSSMSLDELQNIDAGQYGGDALAARVAQGKVLAKYGETEDMKKAAYDKRNATADQQYMMFTGGIKEAENALNKGEKDVAREIVMNLVNKANNTPYKAKMDKDGIKLFMTYEGEDKHDSKAYSTGDMLNQLKKISKTEYTNSFHKNAEFARDINKKSLEQPMIMTNGKEFVQVIATSNPLTSDFHYEAFYIGGKNGKVPVTDIRELREQGFYNYGAGGKNGKGLDGNGSKSNPNKDFYTDIKNIKDLSSIIAENNPDFEMGMDGIVRDKSTSQPAGLSTYQLAIDQAAKTGRFTPERIKELKAWFNGKAKPPGDFNTNKGKILGGAPNDKKKGHTVGSVLDAAIGQGVTKNKRRSPFEADANTLAEPVTEAIYDFATKLTNSGGGKKDRFGLPIQD